MDARERIISFIPEYGSYLMNRLKQGEDGKVACERIKGKKPSVVGVEFAEQVLYKVGVKQKSENQCEVGIRNLCGGQEKEWGDSCGNP